MGVSWTFYVRNGPRLVVSRVARRYSVSYVVCLYYFYSCNSREPLFGLAYTGQTPKVSAKVCLINMRIETLSKAEGVYHNTDFWQDMPIFALQSGTYQ